jgi:PAS domain S-box-containing protein
VRDASGAIIGASKLARDVGEYLRVQQAVRESEERFRTLAENISQFAWMAEPDGRIIWFNKRWYEFSGLPEDRPVQGEGKGIVHPDHQRRVLANYMRAITSGEDYEDTFPMRNKDGEYCWFLSRAKPIRNEQGEIVRWFGTNTDVTAQREQAEQIRLLLMEVNHRSKNMLTTIQALARRSAPDEEGFISRFEDRVQSLAINQDILVGREWREVPVDELVRLQLAFIHDAPGEFRIGGPPLALAPRAAEVIGMAIHELATNSLKYGALSAEHGYVDVGWSRRPDGTGLTLWWRENGGPPVCEPRHHGFGTTLIRDVPRHNLGAKVALHYNREGVCWELTCDDSALSHPSAPAPAAAAG